MIKALLVFSALLTGVLFNASARSEDTRALKLNGGLEARILTVGRSPDRTVLTASMAIANKGKSTVYLLLLFPPFAVDSTGGFFDRFPVVSGIATCSRDGFNKFSPCFGIPKIDSHTVPLQSFTAIEPDVEVTIVMKLSSWEASTGPLASISVSLAYRLVDDHLKDASLDDAEKYRQFRTMNLSFPPSPVIDAKK